MLLEKLYGDCKSGRGLDWVEVWKGERLVIHNFNHGQFRDPSGFLMDSNEGTRNGKVLCRPCGWAWNDWKSFRQHLRLAHFKNSFCVLCRRYIDRKHTLSSHLSIHHNLRTDVFCDCCNWAFINKQVARAHSENMLEKGAKTNRQHLPVVINDCPAGHFLHPSLLVNKEYRNSLMAWQRSQRQRKRKTDSPVLSSSVSPSEPSDSFNSQGEAEESWSSGLLQNLNFKFSNPQAMIIPGRISPFSETPVDNLDLTTPKTSSNIPYPSFDFSRSPGLVNSPSIMDPTELTSEIQRLFPEYSPKPADDQVSDSSNSRDSEASQRSTQRSKTTSDCDSPLLRALLLGTKSNPTPQPTASITNQIPSTLLTPESSISSRCSPFQAIQYSNQTPSNCSYHVPPMLQSSTPPRIDTNYIPSYYTTPMLETVFLQSAYSTLDGEESLATMIGSSMYPELNDFSW